MKKFLTKAWSTHKPLLRGKIVSEVFEAGWEAAMSSIWERLPMPAVGIDPMDSREVEKLLDYIRGNLPSNK